MVYLLLVVFSSLSFAKQLPPIPHLDLSMSGSEYQSILQSRDDIDGDNELDPIIKMGKKLLDWMKRINENRPVSAKLSLSSPEEQPAYPIDTPRVSSPKIILDIFKQLKGELPESIKRVVLGSDHPTEVCPLSDREFLLWAKKIEDLYGRASRWQLQEPMLWGYAARKQTDIRGYFYLTQITDLDIQLSNWLNLPSDKKSQFIEWLKGLCYNSGDNENQCTARLDQSLQKEGNPLSFYRTHLPDGKARWDELFLITQKREDIKWQGTSLDLLTTPFEEPESPEVLDFLRVNIEDEWRWGIWALKLDFIKAGWDTTHIEFIPGATPHVNGLAGSTITMDANQPLSEYHVRWTIRHEFGHTLGFPDCYVEFYDTNSREMISYQIDTTNLMCSRRGKLQQKHYEELKRVYYTP